MRTTKIFFFLVVISFVYFFIGCGEDILPSSAQLLEAEVLSENQVSLIIPLSEALVLDIKKELQEFKLAPSAFDQTEPEEKPAVYGHVAITSGAYDTTYIDLKVDLNQKVASGSGFVVPGGVILQASVYVGSRLTYQSKRFSATLEAGCSYKIPLEIFKLEEDAEVYFSAILVEGSEKVYEASTAEVEVIDE